MTPISPAARCTNDSGSPARQLGRSLPIVTLEDEDGFLNIVVRPDVYVRYRKVLRSTAFIIVEGIIEQQGLVTNVVAREIRAMIKMV